MEKFDLEHFPLSESALRMLSYVTDGFYDKSYVGKWLFQVMGAEYDSVRKIIEELPYQLFPETSTWGLPYHEVKWGLPVRENLSPEERRKLIYQKRDFKTPMNPHRMECYLKTETGFDVRVSDINDPGDYGFIAPHPNAFKVYFLGEGTLDTQKARSVLNKLKQPHTVYTLNDRSEIALDNRGLEIINLKRIVLNIAESFWGSDLLNGRKILNGTTYLYPFMRYNNTVSIVFLSEVVFGLEDNLKIKTVVDQATESNIAALVRVYSTHDCWDTIYLDGKTPLDGGIDLGYKAGNKKSRMLSTFSIEIKENIAETEVIVVTKTKDYKLFSGDVMLNGKNKLNSIYRKERI